MSILSQAQTERNLLQVKSQFPGWWLSSLAHSFDAIQYAHRHAWRKTMNPERREAIGTID